MTISILTPPGVQPLSLARIKQHLRLEDDTEDDYLESIARAATAHVEIEIRQKLIERLVRQSVPGPLSRSRIALQVFPVSSISSSTGTFEEGSSAVIPPESYTLVRQSNVCFLKFCRDFNPYLYRGGIEIDMLCGYGPTGLDVPPNILQAILLLIENWYEHRGAASTPETAMTTTPGLEALLGPVRRRVL